MTISRYISDGSFTLAHAIQIAIYDFHRLFGRGPRLIQIPYFRMEEMDAEMILGQAQKHPTFKGIPIRFSIISDSIELT